MKWLTLPSIKVWLPGSVVVSTDGKYRHTLLNECPEHRKKILDRLRQLAKKAHEDAYNCLVSIWADPLDPLGVTTPIPKPIQDYPWCLGKSTLKGYFGEVMAGIVVRNLSPHGAADWHIPAFLFRLDDLAFDRIAAMIQGATTEDKSMPGHHGDDCIAFQRDSSGKITTALVCEAKCTAHHDASMVRKAHSKLGKGRSQPLEVWRVIDVLRDSQDPEAKTWVEEIRRFMLSPPDTQYERYDLVCYIYGEPPKKASTWLSRSNSHPSYRSQRRLEVAEIRIDGVDDLMEQVYRRDGSA